MEALHVVALTMGITEESGGPSEAVLGFARALAARGHRVEVIALGREGRWMVTPESARQSGFTLEIVPGNLVRRVAGLVERALEHGRSSQSPVFWVNGIWGAQSVAGHVAAMSLRAPLVVRPAGSLGRAALEYKSLKKRAYYNLVEGRILRRAAAIHCMSRIEVNELPLELKSRAFIVPAGVTVPAPTTVDRLPIIGVLARIHPIKRQHLVLDALERLAVDQPQLTLELAGSSSDDAYRTSLATRVQRSSVLRDRVRFLGHVSKADLPAVVGRWLVAVLPSEQENFGHSVVTTAAFGVPVVLTSGVALAAEAELAGAAIVANPSADDLASAIQRLLGCDEPLRRRCVEFAARYDWDHCAAALERHLSSLRR